MLDYVTYLQITNTIFIGLISRVQNSPSSPQADLKLKSLPTQQKKANANNSQQRLEVRLFMM